MKTLRQTAILTQKLTDLIEITVANDTSQEDIEQAFAEEADAVFNRFAQGANCISSHIELQGDVEEENGDEDEDNTELAIQVSKQKQTFLEVDLYTVFGLTVDDLVPETETDVVLVYIIDEAKDKKFRQGLLGYLEERERQKHLTIRQDRALRYDAE